MLIRLESGGQVLHEVAADAVQGELVIGRSRDCAWPTPKPDEMVSSRHACLYRRGSAVWVKDLGSTNGTYHRGKRVLMHRLREGDQLSIGGCVLIASKDRTGGSRAPSEVRVLVGKSRGKRHAITPPKLTVGSDPGSTVLLLDPLVSRHHLEIVPKEDGSCWINDCDSRNGSWVNGEKLAKERMLKDGDRIMVAHMELEFRDGAVRRSNSHAWLRLGIMAVTLVLMLSLYWALKQMKPSSDTLITRVRELAAQESFAAAREELGAARQARKAGEHEMEIKELERLILLWESSVKLWADARRALESGDWVSSSRLLGTLQGRAVEAWSWNAEALNIKRDVSTAKELLDVLNRATAVNRGGETSSAELQVELAALHAAEQRLAADFPSYLGPLRDALGTEKEAMEGSYRGAQETEKLMDGLHETYPAYADILAGLQKLQERGDPRMRERLERLRAPIAHLGRAYDKLLAAADAVRAGRFPEAINANLDLPSADACALDPRVSTARLNLERVFTSLREDAARLQHFTKAIEEQVRAGGVRGYEALQDPATLAHVFACDSLSQPYQRANPAGEYHRVLGAEEFYDRLRALPDDTTLSAMEWPSVSWLTAARELAIRMEDVVAFVAKPDKAWLKDGQLLTQLQQFEATIRRRDELARAMLQRSQAVEGREALIAGGIALRLWSGKLPDVEGKPLNEWLAAQVRQHRERLMVLNDEYTMATLARKIEIRRKVLDTGLPGDPIVRKMWVEQSAAQAP